MREATIAGKPLNRSVRRTSVKHSNFFAKIYLTTVRPIRLDWSCKDDFVRGIYKLSATL